MPHKPSDSVGSASSILTSVSSNAAVEFYEKRLKPSIDAIRKSETPLQELVDAAEKVVEEFATDTRSTFTYKRRGEEISVKLDGVMIAMLASAEECGGESGKRYVYVASAIVGCSKEEDVVGALQGLGTTWLTHLLFIFKTANHANQPNKTPSQAATPTRTETAGHLLKGVGNRKSPFADDVKKRDGFTCVVTSIRDLKHPEQNRAFRHTTLQVAHILRRAIGQFESDHNSDTYHSALTTFDILVNFTRLPVKTLEELRDELDHPSNGMTLQFDVHAAFDRFDWCLKKTEKEDVYAVKIYEPIRANIPENTTHVTFEDHSNDISISANKSKRSAPIDLPNPRYIEIHAAIAEILNTSGAGKFFDELLAKYKDKVAAVRSWPEFEALMETDILTEYITQAFAASHQRK